MKRSGKPDFHPTKLSRTIMVTCLALFGIYGGFWVSTVGAQTGSQGGTSTNTKTVLVDHTMRLNAISIKKVLYNGTQIQAVEPTAQDLGWYHHANLVPHPQGRQIRKAYKFQADQYWFEDLSVELFNRTSKHIVNILFTQCFPETRSAHGGLQTCHNTVFGNLPANVAYTTSGEPLKAYQRPPLDLAPGGTMTFPLGHNLVSLLSFIQASQSLDSITLCDLRVTVWFSDGMQWHEGGYYRPDPDNPGRYLRMPITFFPGPLNGPPAP